jgi:hypothetical protein
MRSFTLGHCFEIAEEGENEKTMAPREHGGNFFCHRNVNRNAQRCRNDRIPARIQIVGNANWTQISSRLARGPLAPPERDSNSRPALSI